MLPYGKTTDLVGEIAAASQEQAQGIDQVNTAVTQMDKVTQQNAANAEESASASEELSAQVEGMNHIVDDLITLVGGRAAGTGQHSSQTVSHHAAGVGTSQRTHQVLNQQHNIAQSDNVFHSIASNNENKAPKQKVAVASTSKPEDVIPLDDDKSDKDDFSSFND